MAFGLKYDIIRIMKMESLIKKALFVLAILALITPLIFSRDTYFPYIMSKIILFRIIVGVMLILYLMLVWKDRKYLPKFNILNISVGIFGLAIIVSGLLGVDPYHSFWSNNERMEGILGIWHYILFFYILNSVFKKKEDWSLFFKAAVIICVLVASLSVLEAFVLHQGILQSNGSIVGGSGNRTYFAVYLLLHACLAAYLFSEKRLEEKQEKKKFRFSFVWLSSAAYLAFLVFLTSCRGSVIGMGVGLIFFLILIAWYYRHTVYKYLALGGLAFILIGGLTFFVLAQYHFFQNNKIISRYTEISSSDASLQGRLFATKVSFKAWQEKPILGWGQENFDVAYNKHYDPGLLKYSNEMFFDTPHNKYLDVLVANGLLGLFAYLFILWTVFSRLKSYFRENQIPFLSAAILASGLLAYFVQNTFLFDIHDSYIIFFLILAFLASLELNKEKTISSFRLLSGYKEKIIKGLLLYAMIVVALFAYYGNIRPYLASCFLRAAILSFQSEQYDQAYRLSERIFDDNTFIAEEAAVALAYSFKDKVRKMSSLESKNFFSLYWSEIEALLEKKPYRLRLYVAKNDLLALVEYEKSPEIFEVVEKTDLQMLTLAPRFPLAKIAYFKLLLANKSYEKLVNFCQKTTEEMPYLAEGYWFWGKALYLLQDKTAGLEKIKKSLDSGYYFIIGIPLIESADMFAANDQNEDALMYLERALQVNPSDSNLQKRISDFKEKINS